MCGIISSARVREIKSSVRMRMVTSRDPSRPIKSLKKDEKGAGCRGPYTTYMQTLALILL